MHGGLTLRLGVTCALFTLLISTAFAAILLSVYQLRESVLEVSRAERAVSAATTLERLLLDVEAGRRGFALSRDPALLVPWKAAQDQIPARQEELEAAVATDPAQASRVAQINLQINDYLDDYADPAIAMEEGAVPKNINAESILAGQRQISSLREQFDDFANAQRTTVERGRQDAMIAGQRALVAGVAGFATSLIGVAILTRSLAVMVARPLHRLVSAADKVAGGDLSVRVATDGPVEIGSMQRTFNSMVSVLEQSRDTLSSIAAEQAALRRVATVAAKGNRRRPCSAPSPRRPASSSAPTPRPCSASNPTAAPPSWPAGAGTFRTASRWARSNWIIKASPGGSCAPASRSASKDPGARTSSPASSATCRSARRSVRRSSSPAGPGAC